MKTRQFKIKKIDGLKYDKIKSKFFQNLFNKMIHLDKIINIVSETICGEQSIRGENKK